MSNREQCMRQLCAADFALWELHLYLDTHPEDLQMLALYKKYEAKAIVLRREYEEKFGPLTTQSGQGVEWLKNPWPWDLEGWN